MKLNLSNLPHIVQSPERPSAPQLEWLGANAKGKWIRTRMEHYKGIYGDDAKPAWEADHKGILAKQEYFREELKRLTHEEFHSLYDHGVCLTFLNKLTEAQERLQRITVVCFSDAEDAMLYKLVWSKV